MQKIIVLITAFSLLIGGAAVAQEEVQSDSPLPMVEASAMMQAAKTACDTVPLGGKRTSPACIAFEAMQASYWQSATRRQQNMLNIAESQTRAAAYTLETEVIRVQTTRNEVASVRDIAIINSDIVYTRKSNDLATIRAEGVLADKHATNTLEAEAAIDPTGQVVDVPALSGQITDLSGQIRDLSAYADNIWLALEESISYQQGICANNPSVSWCQ